VTPALKPSKVAFITGSSRGLGRTLADFLAVQGYTLILTARHADALAETAEALSAYGHPVYAFPGDVTDAAHRRELARVAEAQGGLDLLVNNASDLGVSPLPEMTAYPLEALRELFETNVLAPLALVQDNLEALKKRRGLVVNITSDAAVGAYPGWGGYGSSKAALDLMTRTLAAELTSIGVVAVDPGDLRTQMHQDAFPGEDISDRPLPDVTLPFWAWLLGQDPLSVSGSRFGAQAERWEVPQGRDPQEEEDDAHDHTTASA
jgi:NAD(P)-dependent dehydrogenase (short-subunit alcohol dehydrogenase family)